MMNPHDSAASLNTWMVRLGVYVARLAHFVHTNTPLFFSLTHPIFFFYFPPFQKPEYALQAALTALFILSGHWVPGLAHAALTALHGRALKKGDAGIDVTEIFKQAPAEKRRRAWRLGLYLLTFIYIIYRLVEAAVHALLTPDGKALAQELLHQAAATI